MCAQCTIDQLSHSQLHYLLTGQLTARPTLLSYLRSDPLSWVTCYHSLTHYSQFLRLVMCCLLLNSSNPVNSECQNSSRQSDADWQSSNGTRWQLKSVSQPARCPAATDLKCFKGDLMGDALSDTSIPIAHRWLFFQTSVSHLGHHACFPVSQTQLSIN